jgi:predicted small secreted protein
MNVPVFLLRQSLKGLKSGLLSFVGQDIIDMKKTIVLLSLIMVTGLMTGCANTAQGAGRDIENMGEWIQQKV